MADTSGKQPSPEGLALELGISYSSLRRLFRTHTGMSLKQYQSEVRIRRACELLRNSDRSVKAIAGYLGYNSAFHFSAQFSKASGVSPSQWRIRNRVQMA
ncbi:helix-turn-helix transcriptional regulator [Devosia sp. A8/3-2]|nr:helix-turn-helix transcriptional regulator [Devosia sp. A8/3-2]